MLQSGTMQRFRTTVQFSSRRLSMTMTGNTVPRGCCFELSDTQKKIQNKARKFAREDILPVAADYDKTYEFPWTIFKKAWTLGLINGLIPAHCGGKQRSLFDECLMGEELSFACGGIATALMGSYVSQVPVIQSGTKEQQRKYLGRLLEQPLTSACCVTEPGAGSDVNAIKTEAIKKGDEWILNGQKMWITGGGVANWYLVLARTEPDHKAPASKAFTCFIVERNWPGVTPGRKELNMGIRASDTRGITFEDVRIPKENVLVGEGTGFKTIMKSFDATGVVVGMLATGVAQRCLHEATKYAIEHNIENNHDVAAMLADMAIDVEIARLSWMKSAWEADTGKKHAYSALIANCYGADAANKCATKAVQIFGHDGLNSEYPVEKLMRDAKIFQIFGGTSQIQRLVISREVIANAKSLN